MNYVILSTRDLFLFGKCWLCRHLLMKPPRPPNDSTENFRPARSSKSRTFLLKMPEKQRQFSGIRKLFWFPRLVSFESAFNFSQDNIYLMTKGCCRFFGYTSHKKFSHFTIKLSHNILPNNAPRNLGECCTTWENVEQFFKNTRAKR